VRGSEAAVEGDRLGGHGNRGGLGRVGMWLLPGG
jgi:hypothetical protein